MGTKHFQSRWSELVDPKTMVEDVPGNFLAPKIDTYYRSKAFVSQVSINPLIAASAPLFFLIETIKALNTAPDISKLHDDLIHEINAFEHQAQAHNYRSYIILAARYVLCLWIDQTILSTTWGEKCEWEKISLADTPESRQDSPFYLLVNRCVQEPTLYIDLLELFYLCLSLGFQGNNEPAIESNHFKITEMRNGLFEIISKQHQGLAKRLEIDTALKSPIKPFSLRTLLRPAIAIGIVFLLIGTYANLNARLHGIPFSSPTQSTP